MKNAVKSTSFLNNLDERDPLAKFIQTQRTTVVGYGPSLMVFSSSFSDLQDYFDRIIKHPGQMDLLISTILKNTLDSDPNRPLLVEQYALLKATVMKLDEVVGDRSASDLLNLQNLIGDVMKIIIPTRRLITKVDCASQPSRLGLLQLRVSGGDQAIALLPVRRFAAIWYREE